MTIPLLNRNILNRQAFHESTKMLLTYIFPHEIMYFGTIFIAIIAMDYFWLQTCVQFCQLDIVKILYHYGMTGQNPAFKQK